MGSLLKSLTTLFKRLMLDADIHFASVRTAAAFFFAASVLINPFLTAGWLKIYLYAVCAGTLFCALEYIKSSRKKVWIALVVFAILLLAIFRGRGDAVSGVAAAVFAAFNGAASFIAASRSRNKWETLWCFLSGVAACLLALAVIIRSGQLGVRYLDQLHNYALAFAGCGFASLSQMRKR
ncbi:MAG: hypothetical protein J6S24_01420 [Lentisphaeria bacterium]|nr:hypothetical protein [Lentisphaeria bacterium]